MSSALSHVALNVPCLSDSFQLHTDASGVGMSSALHVIHSSIQWQCSTCRFVQSQAKESRAVELCHRARSFGSVRH